MMISFTIWLTIQLEASSVSLKATRRCRERLSSTVTSSFSLNAWIRLFNSARIKQRGHRCWFRSLGL